MIPKTCESCGRPFTSRASRTRFCSRVCSDDWKRGRRNPKNAGPKRTVAERFWEKVARSEPAECWEWRGKRERSGYGILMASWKPYKTWKAHRLSWMLHNGPIPDGLCVLHHCDNPPCVNPNHLYAGTKSDNAKDRERRNRGNQPCGENSSVAKVTDAQVAEIRRRVAAGETQLAVGHDYGIKQPHVSRIVRGINR